jgi:thiol-disulfide isomerase/thioredoxin
MTNGLRRRETLALTLGLAFAASTADVGTAKAGLPRFDGGPDRRASAWERVPLLAEDGTPVALDALPRPLTLMVLWASWCAACRAELPALPGLAARLGRETEVLLVSRPEDAERDFPVARHAKLGFRLLSFAPDVPPDLLADAFGQEGSEFMVPQIVAISGSPRRVVWSHIGPLDWTDDSVVERVRRLRSASAGPQPGLDGRTRRKERVGNA